jgi:branched-chain amino acid transport system permease protein
MNYMAYVDPEVVFSLHHISIMAILVAIIGGVGTLWGPVAGAFVMIGIQEMFRSSLFGLGPKWLSESHVLVFGLLVVLVILYLPRGLVGDWDKLKSTAGRVKKLKVRG